MRKAYPFSFLLKSIFLVVYYNSENNEKHYILTLQFIQKIHKMKGGVNLSIESESW